MIRGLLLLVIAGVCSSCAGTPRTYGIPPQQSTALGTDPGGLAAFISMDDPAADDYIVHDISPGRDHHRWAFKHPELRFRLNEPAGVKLVAEFAVPETTFKTTGSVTITPAIDGKPLPPFRCDHAGDYRMEYPVPSGWIAPAKEVHVTFETTPRWVSPDDGAELSFYLGKAGFIH